MTVKKEKKDVWVDVVVHLKYNRWDVLDQRLLTREECTRDIQAHLFYGIPLNYMKLKKIEFPK